MCPPHKAAALKWVVYSNCFCSAYIYHFLFIIAVKSIESKTESFSGADREGEDPEQQRLFLQTAGGTGKAQTSNIQGEQLITQTQRHRGHNPCTAPY